MQEVQPLLDEIASRTGLPVALEGIYRWVAFLPSRSDERVPVANRYFGVFQDGSLKLRGLEARRGDTPPFIGKVQMGLLERLARSVPEPAGTMCAVAETGGLGRAVQPGSTIPATTISVSHIRTRPYNRTRHGPKSWHTCARSCAACASAASRWKSCW